MSEAAETKPYGIVGEFLHPDDIVRLIRRLRLHGFRCFDVYAPTPIEEIDRAVVPRRRWALVLIMFLAGCAGAFLCYYIEYYAAAINFPINVGGRPYNSWPAFVPIAWEICAFFTVYAGFAAFFLFCRLPQLYHPIFNVPGFDRASQDRFFLCVEASDPYYNVDRISRIFARSHAVRITEVPR
jgi:hypothetical protein